MADGGAKVVEIGMPSVSCEDYMFSKSSKAAFDKIVEGLKDGKTNVIGLYGTGGVGKTSLAKQVIKSDEALQKICRDVMVVVSQIPDLMAIQNEVAAGLGLFFEDEKDVSMKAEKLKLYLEDKANILIILDDVWEMIELSDIGIAFTADQKNCKILVTTRYQKICSLMKCEKDIHIDVMCESEAWDLFKKRADLNDESPMIDTAKEVSKECGGLPIAIVPLATALVNNTSSQWKEALQCLRSSNLQGIENIEDKNAYKCLKISYDKLIEEEIKFCFLLCSLIQKDRTKMEMEVLVSYAWGLDICKNVNTIEEARIKVQLYIDHLKKYCLLRSSSRNKVSMHNVVRHFALWMGFNAEKNFTVGHISKKSAINESLETYMAISLLIEETQELQSGLVCQNLKLLQVCGDDATHISYDFFEQMKALKVLTINRCTLAPYLPDIPVNLRVLCLKGCRLGNISSLGNLKKLEVLRLSHSDIRELPDEIGEIEELKVLDLLVCEHLEKIPAGLIRKLSYLEELYVTGSYIKPWKARLWYEDSTGKACLSELNSLAKLTVLSLDNIGKCLLPYSFSLPNLTRYQITESWCVDNYPTSKTLYIHDEVNAISLNAFKIFFSTVEHLKMSYNDGIRCIVPEIESGVFNNLISLDLMFWKKMVCLIGTSVKKEIVFPNLKKLNLWGMDSLKKMCQGQITNEFLRNLETVNIQKCPKLCSIFQVHEELRKEGNSMLVSMNLIELPELRCVWEGPTQHINLKCLRTVKIVKCRKLKFIFSLSMAQTLVRLQSLYIEDCDDLEHIIEEKEEIDLESSTSLSHLIFTELVMLNISTCNKLRYIFVAPSCLQQVKTIYLYKNGALEQIFKYAEGNKIEIELSHLQRLAILGSPNLVNFSGGYCSSLSFPSLQTLEIMDCAIKFPARMEAKQLQSVFLSNVPKDWLLIIEDLPNLLDLSVETFIGVEEVIRHEVYDQTSDLVLPIQDLGLSDLPQLAHICYSPTHTHILQNLTHLSIYTCHKLTYIFPPTLAQNLPKLQSLTVHDCNELVQLIGNDSEGVTNQLKLDSFRSLQRIIISRCKKIKFIYPLSIVGGLPELQQLDVQDGDGLEYVFGKDTLEEGKDGVVREEVVLPQLKNIVLKKLPSLGGFSVAANNFIFPLLKSETQLEVEGCPKITEIFSISPTHGTTIKRENASLIKAEDRCIKKNH